MSQEIIHTLALKSGDSYKFNATQLGGHPASYFATNTQLEGHTHTRLEEINNEPDVAGTNHVFKFGASGHNKVEIFEYGGEFNVWESRSDTNTHRKVLGVSPTEFTYNGNPVITSKDITKTYQLPVAYSWVRFAKCVGTGSAIFTIIVDEGDENSQSATFIATAADYTGIERYSGHLQLLSSYQGDGTCRIDAVRLVTKIGTNNHHEESYLEVICDSSTGANFTTMISNNKNWSLLDSLQVKSGTVDSGYDVAYEMGTPWEVTLLNNRNYKNLISSLPITCGGTGNNTGYITTGKYSGSTVGSKATIEGINNIASGDYSHAEGEGVHATGFASHAEGQNGGATGAQSHSGGMGSYAEGTNSFAHGEHCTAEGHSSVTFGYVTDTRADNQFVIGHYNKISTYGSTSGDENSNTEIIDQFMIGNGWGSGGSQRSNSFRVRGDGAVYGKKAYNSTGADYAEYFEWLDGNSNNEDRRGLFVTLEGEKIKIATEGDYVLGIISGEPAIIGNSDIDWKGRFLTDEYGTPIREEYQYEENITDNITGEITVVTKISTRPKQNPNYDPDQEYISRSARKEWAAVGMMGVLSVRDDGTCQVNGFCKLSQDGVATASDTGYRVISRPSDRVVKVVFK